MPGKLRLRGTGENQVKLGVSQFDNRLDLLDRIARDIMPAFRP